ncbi:hypothetical protein B0H15DRAFT_342144 [Mycena belliarum]|uniref:Nephrocystin 3-like N-terminal domain-containing protein n=1 Tax=Mycena belliarum TaxID=1033014 RepID=A0AAD6U1F6_9AGAR|nr:hypothetical protein B0H15DRAFT_342144 [Mycena belliae]
MSFAFGDHLVIQGGTFNQVAGNLNVFSSVSLAPDISNTPRLAVGEDEPSSSVQQEAERRGIYARSSFSSMQPTAEPHFSGRATGARSTGTYNTVSGNITNLSIASHGQNGLDILYCSVAADALYNSAERPPEPSCHPGTRESVLERLREWSIDASSEGTLMWLHGCAGVGKSAVAQAFAAHCDENSILGASFFFQRGNAARGTWKHFFPTLAYQLACAFPELRMAIQQVVEADRLIVGQAMRLQFQKLIVQPLKRAPPTIKPIIIVDGLDECDDRHAQVLLLELVVEALRDHPFPVRFLLASRPEPPIREVLDNLDICRYCGLRPDGTAFAEIQQYYLDEFTRIRQAHLSRGTVLDADWPGPVAIEQLVEKSSGTFIYASTVLRYVDDGYSHPVDQLDSVLRLDPRSTAPLDDLYSRILGSFPDRPLLRRVLHAVIRTDGELDPEEMDVALRLRGGTSRLALRGLHSLLSIPSVRSIGYRHPVTLLHASLSDFLVDEARSSTLCIATSVLDSDFVRSLIRSISAVSLARTPLLFSDKSSRLHT